jgi:hypothetical protein
MSDIVIAVEDVLEGTDASDVGAIVGGDGRTLLVHSDITGPVLLDIIERRTQTPIYSTSFTAGTTGPLYDVPQVDEFWGLDLIGYNWRYLPTVAQLAAAPGAPAWLGGRSYMHVYRFPTASDGTVRAVFIRNIVALPV